MGPRLKGGLLLLQARRLEISGPCAAPYRQSSMGGVMDQVCRLLGCVPNAHRDLTSIGVIVADQMPRTPRLWRIASNMLPP